MSLALKLIIIAGFIFIWFFSQNWLHKLHSKKSHLPFDWTHQLTDRWNQYLQLHPEKSKWLLILSSLLIDLVGVGYLIWCVMGPSFSPFWGLVIVFALRQINQATTQLPTPPGIIWYDPKVPSLFVTYKVSQDFFFSGHTALVALAFFESFSYGNFWLTSILLIVVLFQCITILVLRAHWTMDVFTGLVAAYFGHQISSLL